MTDTRGPAGQVPAMPDGLRRAAEAARGFMPPPEGMALYRAAVSYAAAGPVLEIGTYCGKSTIYLAAARYRARPSGGGMKPRAASAARRRSSGIAGTWPAGPRVSVMV